MLLITSFVGCVKTEFLKIFFSSRNKNLKNKMAGLNFHKFACLFLHVVRV